MKVHVVGGGSLGLIYAGLLSDVSDCLLLTRRQEQADAVAAHGVTIKTSREQTVKRPTASADPTELSNSDVVLVLTKAYDAESAASVVSKYSQPHAVVVSMQSGLGALDYFNESCGAERVLGGISYLGESLTWGQSVFLTSRSR